MTQRPTPDQRIAAICEVLCRRDTEASGGRTIGDARCNGRDVRCGRCDNTGRQIIDALDRKEATPCK